jgi:hypothetical protein
MDLTTSYLGLALKNPCQLHTGPSGLERRTLLDLNHRRWRTEWHL